MTLNSLRAGGKSQVVIILLSAILVALVILIVVVMKHGTASPARIGPTTAASGQTVTGADLKQAGVESATPSKPLDTGRIRETYKPGQKFHIIAKGTLKTRASAKDWGVEQVMTLQYAAENEFLKSIESNDGTQLVETVEIVKSRNLGIFCNVEDVRIDAGPGGTLLLLGLDLLTEQPGTWSSLNGQSAKTILEAIPAVQSWANRVYTDEAAKSFAYIDTLQGKKVRVEYVNGQGVTKLTPIGCSLSADEQEVLMDGAACSDAYILPQLDSKEGDTWTIDGRDFIPVIDPSLRTTVTGTLTAVRGPNGGTANKPEAKINLTGGVLDLKSVDATSETVGRWAPRGELTYSFAEGVVTKGTMTGKLSMDKHSTAHILFEARQVVEPDYEVTYSCEVTR